MNAPSPCCVMKAAMKPSSPWRAGAVLGLVFVLSGCTEDAAGTVRSYVDRYDTAARTYTLTPTDVPNLESFRALRGRDVELRSGAGFTGAFMDLVDHGHEFSLRYTWNAEHVAVPSELEDVYAVSVYHHLDDISSLLRAHGYVPAQRLQVFYFPYADNALLGDNRSSLMDNAAYDLEHHVFLILPSFLLNKFPLLLNYGVLGHEFGHSVIQQTVFEQRTFGASDATRDFSSMHEGAADLIGYVASGDTNFILPSFDTDRDLAKPLTYTAEDLAELENPSADYDPHRHGSYLARALYEAWPKSADGELTEAERGRMLDVLLASLHDLGPLYDPSTFSFADLGNLWVTHLPANEQTTTCAVLQLRLAPLASHFTNCPPVAP